jgi:hypothetical protein
VFNKKQKQQEETEKTQVVEAKDEQTVQDQLTPEDKKILELINQYKKYDNIFNAQDFLTVNQAYVEAEKLNVDFAVYCEIVGLREDIRELTKAVKTISNETKR